MDKHKHVLMPYILIPILALQLRYPVNREIPLCSINLQCWKQVF